VLVEVEEIELNAEPAVVAPLCLLEALEMKVEILLREEGRAVDAGELLFGRVAAPVGTGEPGQLERLDRPGVDQVRTAAEIGEIALRVERDRSLGLAHELDLVGLVLGQEALASLLTIDLLALPLPPLRQLAPDLLLDAGQVVFGNRLREVEVVVETVSIAGPIATLTPG